MKRQWNMFGMALVCAFLLFGCGDDKADEAAMFCPSLSDVATWQSYGHFTLNEEGRDSTARKIVRDCGWHVYKGHNGGIGDTLQIASPGEEVVFAWAFNDFYAFRLTTGWQGATDQGLMMGDTVADLFRKHPGFQFSSPGQYLLYRRDEGIRVRAYFDVNGKLNKLLVGFFFRNAKPTFPSSW